MYLDVSVIEDSNDDVETDNICEQQIYTRRNPQYVLVISQYFLLISKRRSQRRRRIQVRILHEILAVDMEPGFEEENDERSVDGCQFPSWIHYARREYPVSCNGEALLIKG